jgi:putative membrane-bound dehydrogenase-like protein
MKSIHIAPDLSIELVASEPLIASPVAIDWGNDGKLWVVEMADYPYGMDGKGKPGGRVRYLESTHGDGHYDKSTLFLTDIKMPNGVIAWGKGVIVTSATDIFYAEDTDGDGKADKREVLFKGFKEGNPQLRENGLRWGMDNWLYVASGLTGGVVESVKTHEKLDLKGHDLRIRPETGEMELVSGPSQFGREHDDAGQWFGVDNSHPLFHYVLEDRYLRRNPELPAADPKQQLLPLPLPPVFPKSPFAKRYIGLDHHGHFTSACGISIYRDDLLFTSKDGATHALICEPVHNLVQHQVLTPDGVTFKAQRVEGEKGADFLAAEDNWFRPVMTRCGPDGAIYVVDMYRYMIEHPDWLNAVGKSELAPYYRDGAEKGRIYRVYPKSSRPRAIPKIDGMTMEQMVELLESPSGFLRDRAQMTLVMRKEASAAPVLRRMVAEAKDGRARLQALCTLDGLGELTPEVLKEALADSDAGVRVAGLRLCEASHDPGVIERLRELSDDPSPVVRLQLACTLGEYDGPLPAAGLMKLAAEAGDDPFLSAAVGSSLPRHRTRMLARVLADPAFVKLPVFGQLVQMSVAKKDLAMVGALLEKTCREDSSSPVALARLADTLAARGLSLEAVAGEGQRAALLREALARGAARAGDASAPVAQRMEGVNLLGRLAERRAEDLRVAESLFTTSTPGELQLAGLRAAARCAAGMNDASLPQMLLSHWATFSPGLRGAVADALLPRETWALALAQSPAARDLDFSRRQRLLNHPSAKVKAAAKATLAQGTVNADRQKVIDGYHEALTLKGDATHGEALFAEHCATCHRVGAAKVGHDIGPNLLTVRDWPSENLLTALLDPDRNVEPRFVAYTADLSDGTTLTGLLTGESAGNVIVKTLDDQDHSIPRSALKSLTSTERSLMPQGFESALSAQDVADLMSFVRGPTTGE